MRRRARTRIPAGATALGIELAAAVIGFSLLGYWIDRRYDTAPWALLICAVLGIVGGLYNLIKGSLRLSRRERDRDEPD